LTILERLGKKVALFYMGLNTFMLHNVMVATKFQQKKALKSINNSRNLFFFLIEKYSYIVKVKWVIENFLIKFKCEMSTFTTFHPLLEIDCQVGKLWCIGSPLLLGLDWMFIAMFATSWPLDQGFVSFFTNLFLPFTKL
jgi:hypothetical protein